MEKAIITIQIENATNSCFVAMPFSPLFKTQYEAIINPAITELELECVRGDEIYSQQRIMDDIWTSLRACRLVVAELTTRNPNVMYEIGLAHALGKPVIIMTRDENDVPFDLKDLRYLFYDVNDPFWGENLKKGLQNLIKKVLENPNIGVYLRGITYGEVNFPKLPSKIEKKEPKEPKYYINGLWKASWIAGDTRHEIILTITQNGNKINASGIVSFPVDDQITVIQEIFQGFLSGNSLSITGVNYSYINRGASDAYHLDNFELIVEGNDLIKGSYKDAQGFDLPEVIFERFSIE